MGLRACGWLTACPGRTPAGISWPGNKVSIAMGIVQTTEYWKLGPHSISPACPSPLLLADQAAVQLRTNATVNATLADSVLALKKVNTAKQWVALRCHSCAAGRAGP
jgi:hypothetical protein